MTRSKKTVGSGGAEQDEGVVSSDGVAETTGRYVVVMSDEVYGDQAAIAEALRSVAGVSSIASTTDFEASVLDVSQARTADATVFVELGIAVVAADPNQVASISAAAAQDRRIVAIEPERILYAISGHPPLSVDYLRGYRDAVTTSMRRRPVGRARLRWRWPPALPTRQRSQQHPGRDELGYRQRLPGDLYVPGRGHPRRLAGV
ncbi:MAG: hypothetical protein M3186_16920 [Actinomycetota bacterium]|nr:hypothetical protein [Actinomycetota bacterium]